MREEKYLVDSKFINELNKQTIFFGDIENDNNKFYLIPKQLILTGNKNKPDHIIFITTIFQLKILSECNYIFIDGTFRSCPNQYYQLLNIIGYINKKISIYQL